MLRGRHVALAPLRDADSPVLFAWINEREEVLRNAPYHPVHEADHRSWFDAVRQRADTVIFGIRTLDGDRLVGSCQLSGIDRRHGTAELQIRLGEVSARGRGWGTEAVGLLVRHAFADLGLHRVVLHVLAGNAAAIRVYEKAGFVREGVLREAAYIDGRRLDLVVMALLRPGGA